MSSVEVFMLFFNLFVVGGTAWTSYKLGYSSGEIDARSKIWRESFDKKWEDFKKSY